MAAAKKFLENVQFHRKENFLTFAVNPKLYSAETIFSAAYNMLDRAFVLVDGRPDSLIVLSMQPKEGRNLNSLAQEFSNQLLNSAVNTAQSKNTKAMREELIKRVFLTQAGKR